MNYKFLIVEDSYSEIEVCKETVDVMNDEAEDNMVSVDFAKTIDEAMKKLQNEYYHGAVVDIKLKDNENGNDVIKAIMDKYRMPVIVYTATPDVEQPSEDPIKILKKADYTPDMIITELMDEISTGMFTVLGGRGDLEKGLSDIFWKILYPQIDIWKDYKKKNIDTEKILLRYAIAHILEMLDENGPEYCTQEMYIKRMDDSQLQTGSLVRKKSEDNAFYIVLSPPCDLAVHGGGMKTERVLVCQIENKVAEILKQRTKKISDENERKQVEYDVYKSIMSNRYSGYYHWLPDNSLFVGGLINFRKIETSKPSDFLKNYESLEVKISYLFVKNILNRFSAYYSRQGQPDFNIELELNSR